MDWYATVFELIDMRSFSNLWYWIALAVVWYAAGPDVALLAGAVVGIWLIAMNLLAARSDERQTSPDTT